MIYVLFTAILFALSLATLGAAEVRRQVYFPVLLALFVFAAFRFQVGCDWSGYYYQYLAAEYDAKSKIVALDDPIWWLIFSGVSVNDFVYPVINVVASAIFFFGVHSLARRQPDPLAFLVMLFPILVINMPMSGIRQGAAIGVICIAFGAFIDRRPLRYAALVLIAGGLHISALVFMVLLPIMSGRASAVRLLIAAMLAIPGLFFLSQGSSTGTVVNRYIGSGVDAFGAIFRVGAIFISAMYFFIFLSKKWKINFNKDHNIANFGAIGMIVTLFILPASTVVSDRFAYYLVPLQAMIFARIPFIHFNSSKWLHVVLPYLGLFVMIVGWTQTSTLFEQCYLPYRSWIFGIPAGSMLKDEVLP